MMWKYGLKFVSKFLGKAGYLLVPKWHLDKWIHSELLKNVLYRTEIDCVFDVGANRGQFRNFLRNEVGFKGLILSFEPIPYLAERCKKNAKSDTAWHVYEMALGDKEALLPIHVTSADEMSSLLTPLSEHQPFESETSIRDTKVVQVKTLDCLFSRIKI